MKIKEGTILEVNHTRKSTFTAKAMKDFDTDDEWYDLIVVTPTESNLTNKVWNEGEELCVRNNLCKVKIVENVNN